MTKNSNFKQNNSRPSKSKSPSPHKYGYIGSGETLHERSIEHSDTKSGSQQKSGKVIPTTPSGTHTDKV